MGMTSLVWTGQKWWSCLRGALLARIDLMNLVINGQPRDFTPPLTLTGLLQELGMKSDRVAIELNRSIVSRDRWTETGLADGDRLEIVHFVGGGKIRIWPLTFTDESKFRPRELL